MRKLKKELREYLSTSKTDGYLQEIPDGFLILQPVMDMRRVYLEVTNECNLACRTCVRHSWQEDSGYMSFEVFSTLLEQLKAFPSLKKVQISGFGEPLAHPDILEMISLLLTRNLEVEVVTNGILLSSAVIDKLISCGLNSIVVSVDSLAEEEYQHIRTGGELSIVLENLNEIRQQKQQKNSLLPKVGIAFVAMKKNYHQLPNLINLPNKYGVSFAVITNLLPYTKEMQDEILYDRSRDEIAKVITWTNLGFKTRWPKMRLSTERYCGFIGNRSVSISWEGGVSPCYPLLHSYTCYIYGKEKEVQSYLLGNITEEGLDEIWAAPEFIFFRHKVRGFEFPSCTDCNISKECDMARTNTMDCWQNTPSCGDCLWARKIIQCP